MTNDEIDKDETCSTGLTVIGFSGRGKTSAIRQILALYPQRIQRMANIPAQFVAVRSLSKNNSRLISYSTLEEEEK